MALLLLYVSSEISESNWGEAGEQLLFGPLCSYNKGKKRKGFGRNMFWLLNLLGCLFICHWPKPESAGQRCLLL